MRGAGVWVVAFCTAFAFPAFPAPPDAPGVSNFHQVNEHVYRGAQPHDQGWHSLAKLGIKTVIDLRHSDEQSCAPEKKAVEALGMHYISMPLNGTHAPSDRDINRLLGLLSDQTVAPVFVHCRRGADRTGTVVACYRIAHDGWTNQKALAEAKSNGMSWLEFGMQRYVLGFHAPAPAAPGYLPPVGPAAPAPASPATVN